MNETPALRVTLETLLELPLASDALATVWREAMGWTAEPALRRRLALELAVLELDRCRELGESEGWATMLPRLEGWEATWQNLCAVSSDDDLDICRPQWQGAMDRLLTALQQHLNTSMQAPPALDSETTELDGWAELLWWCWQRRDPTGGDGPMRERLCRLGAIAWSTLAGFRGGTPAGLQASGRAQALLVELAHQTPPDVVWIRNGLQDGLAQHLAAGAPAGGDWGPWMAWAELIVERSPSGEERQELDNQLWPARAALEIAETLGV